MAIINMTPHVLNIFNADGEEATVFPSGTVARVSVTYIPRGQVEDIDLFQAVYGDVEGLPAPNGKDIFVVSGMVASRVHRADVYSPGELHRDAAGKPDGCFGLKAS